MVYAVQFVSKFQMSDTKHVCSDFDVTDNNIMACKESIDVQIHSKADVVSAHKTNTPSSCDVTVNQIWPPLRGAPNLVGSR